MLNPSLVKNLYRRRNADDYDRRMVAFIRLGRIFDNYYQVEIPLKPTDYAESSSNIQLMKFGNRNLMP